MAGYYRSVRVVYDGRGADILLWCVTTALFSLITLGLYLPVGINRLVRYILESTELQIQELPATNQGEPVTDSTSNEKQ